MTRRNPNYNRNIHRLRVQGPQPVIRHNQLDEMGRLAAEPWYLKAVRVAASLVLGFLAVGVLVAAAIALAIVLAWLGKTLGGLV